MSMSSERRQPLILAIDDEVTIRESYRIYLENRGYGVVVGKDGEEGIALFHAHQPDLVLVDLRMPGVDGFDVLRSVRSVSKEVPVIVISGTGDANDVVKALQAGATHFLTKPLLSLRSLKDKIADALERKQLIEENKRYQQGLEDTIAQLKTMQKQLVESEKMASLGKLVAGIAHEINTPLGIGVTAASHLGEKVRGFKTQYDTGTASHQDLKHFLNIVDESTRMIEGNLTRAAQLIRSFKQVAVDQSDESPRSFNFAEYMADILLSLKPRLKKTTHRVDLSCPSDLSIFSYPGALARIMTNLIINALVHGFEDRENGTITIQVVRADSNILIECSDDGRGMTREVVENVFEPFFTTRRGRGGSGLGMHMVFNLVTQTLGGTIRCESEPGAGTRFMIQFPVKEGDIQ
jgi:signal transduction histidine kinase